MIETIKKFLRRSKNYLLNIFRYPLIINNIGTKNFKKNAIQGGVFRKKFQNLIDSGISKYEPSYKDLFDQENYVLSHFEKSLKYNFLNLKKESENTLKDVFDRLRSLVMQDIKNEDTTFSVVTNNNTESWEVHGGLVNVYISVKNSFFGRKTFKEFRIERKDEKEHMDVLYSFDLKETVKLYLKLKERYYMETNVNLVERKPEKVVKIDINANSIDPPTFEVNMKKRKNFKEVKNKPHTLKFTLKKDVELIRKEWSEEKDVISKGTSIPYTEEKENIYLIHFEKLFKTDKFKIKSNEIELTPYIRFIK